MTFDLARARAETPGCAEVTHFNNAGAALMPDPVIRAQIEQIEREGRMGGYEAAAATKQAFEGVYDSLARLLSCRRAEIALVENATVAWQLAMQSVPLAPGDRILTAEAEYASNYIAYLRLAERLGVETVAVPSDESGQLSVPALERLVDARVKLIAVTHVPTNGGLVNPAEAIGKVARAAGIPYLLDACQSAGQMELDVERLGCDLLSATGRKYLRGPRGSGFLYVRREILERLEPPVLDLHSADWTAPGQYVMRPDARRFENWEFNHAAVLGLGAAVDYALGWGLPAIEARVTALAATLREGLAEIPGVTVTDLGRRRCGIVTFTLAGTTPPKIQAALAREKINVSTSTRSSTRLDMERRGLSEVVRASVHYYNSEAEVARLVAAVAGL